MTRQLITTIAGLALSAQACSRDDGSTTVTPPPAAVVVDPGRFLGDVPCLEAEGAMRRYVATLFDVSTAWSPADAGIDEHALPSSPPVSCLQTVSFQRVVPGRQYAAEIQAYDRTDIVPVATGSAAMVDPATGEFVAPRWTTSCGRGSGQDETTPEVDGGSLADAAPPEPAPEDPDAGAPELREYLDCRQAVPHDRSGPVCAERAQTVVIRGCAPLQEHAQSAVHTSIAVDVRAALTGQLACEIDGGEIAGFSVTLQGSGDAAQPARCGDRVVFDDLEPGKSYRFSVQAFTAAEDAQWTSTCFQVAVKDVRLRAACDPLVPQGA